MSLSLSFVYLELCRVLLLGGMNPSLSVVGLLSHLVSVFIPSGSSFARWSDKFSIDCLMSSSSMKASSLSGQSRYMLSSSVVGGSKDPPSRNFASMSKLSLSDSERVCQK